MKEIIAEVFQAEEKVNALLQQARAQASEIKGRAEKEITGKIGETQEKARQIMQTSLEEAKKEAEHIREQRLQQAGQEKEILLNQNTDTINNLVERICQMILTTDHDT
jgi:vacuolar-type H+-ATPase subunit H